MTTTMQNSSPSTSAYKYKSVVADILKLPFEAMPADDLTRVWYLSWVAAVEFAEALRVSLELYPNHPGLQAMAFGELDTDNLALKEFQEPADHYQFLGHFLRKHNVLDGLENQLGTEADKYLDACRALPPEVRAMTVFSREEELAGIFARILEASTWDADGLYAFHHYLTTHIVLDSSEGGHAELLSDFKVNDDVLPFYEARLESFRLVPSLASSTVFK